MNGVRAHNHCVYKKIDRSNKIEAPINSST